MKRLPHNLGKLMAVMAIALVAIVLLVAVATVTAAPAAHASAAPVAPALIRAAVAQTATQTTTATNAAQPTAAAPAAAAPAAEEVPAAIVRIVAMPANPADAGAITTTIKQTTDTAVGPKSAVLALMSTGLSNVPVAVPVKLMASPAVAEFAGNVTWGLLKPADSKATLVSTNTVGTQFTPDVVGFYMATATFKSADGKTSGELGAVQIHAGMFEGVTAGKCATCHPGKVEEWLKTGHAKIFSDEIDNTRTPDVPTHYVERCASCHNTGYYPGAANGGFKDAMTKAKWEFPTWKMIDAAGKKTGPSNWEKIPAEVKNMANIQC